MTKYRVFFLVFVLGLFFDQGTKIWARRELKPLAPASKVVIKGFWDFRYSENPGSAFGFFRNFGGARSLLLGMALLPLGVLVLWLRKLPYRTPWLCAQFGLLAAGGLGNITDRFLFSRVTDFIVLKVTTQSRVYEWYTFNVADAMLVCGTMLITIDWPRDAIFRDLP